VQKDPQLAFKWTELISNPQLRAETEERRILQWSRDNRAAAVDFVQQSSAIAPEQKQSLIQKIQSLPSP